MTKQNHKFQLFPSSSSDGGSNGASDAGSTSKKATRSASLRAPVYAQRQSPTRTQTRIGNWSDKERKLLLSAVKKYRNPAEGNGMALLWARMRNDRFYAILHDRTNHSLTTEYSYLLQKFKERALQQQRPTPTIQFPILNVRELNGATTDSPIVIGASPLGESSMHGGVRKNSEVESLKREVDKIMASLEDSVRKQIVQAKVKIEVLMKTFVKGKGVKDV